MPTPPYQCQSSLITLYFCGIGGGSVGDWWGIGGGLVGDWSGIGGGSWGIGGGWEGDSRRIREGFEVLTFHRLIELDEPLFCNTWFVLFKF